MQITPERWRRIRTIFEAAIDRPTEDRGAFLDDACSGDDELLRQVGSLIVASEGSGEAMANAIADAAANPAATTRVGVPERVGRYRILDTLGEGGMGLVLLAERDDDSYHQEVAVKVIKQTLTSEEVVRRFENERQILADLDHSAIASLLDGGTTGEGVPFLVMEYVDGRPIDVYCREEGLTLEQRLVLFTKICDAVAHAHHRLVVHRDLKPTNILVTSDGRPKLLDFGIAKLLDPERAGAGLTRTGMAALTPEYASPEQVLGEPITTASEVYSLGVLLYELLVGHSPYGDSIQTPAAILKAICEERPERPSDARRRTQTAGAVTAAAKSKLGSDLDWILLTALRKEPERRYASVEELAQDLRALLDGRPVMAHPDTWHYRTAKWFRRHWKLAAAGILIVVALGAGLAARTIEAQRAERAAAEAERAAAESEAATEFLASLFFSANPYSPDAATTETTARDLLDLGAERLPTELADQPRVQARLSEQIAEIYLDLNLPEAARPLLEQAAAARGRLPEDLQALTGNMFFQGRLAAELGELDRSVDLLGKAVEMARQAYGEDSWVVALPLHEVGRNLGKLRRWEEAQAALEQVLAIREAQDPPDAPGLGAVHSELGVVIASRGDLGAASHHQQRAYELFRQAYGDRHPETNAVRGRLASLDFARRDYAAAAAARREVLALNRPVFGDHPRIAGDFVKLGDALRENGELDAAVEAFSEALVLLERIDKGGSPLAGSASAGLGRTFALQGADSQAEERLREATRLTPDDPGVLTDLGRFLLERQRATEAEAMLRNALAIVMDGYPEWRVASARRWVGASLIPQGRYAEAEQLLAEAYDGCSGDFVVQLRERRKVVERQVELYGAWGRAQQEEQARARLDEMED